MKIFPEVSHLDHGLTEGQRDFIAKRFADRDAFFIETVELPVELGGVPCSLIGPVTGQGRVDEEDVVYSVRGNRKCASRMLRALEIPALVRTVTVIAGPAGKADGLPEDCGCVLYTAFGGPKAPREPGDPAIASWEELQESRAFWAQHALIRER